MAEPALQLWAGPAALRHLRRHGLQPGDIHAIAAAAGGPKGLVLGALDRHLFGHWLPQRPENRPEGGAPIHLIGASIGAWRLASACLPDALAGLTAFEAAYIAQDYPTGPGGRRPDSATVTRLFRQRLHDHLGQAAAGLAWTTPRRYALHLVTSRGLGPLAHPGRAAMALGYAAAWSANALGRRHLGRWLRRTVFSSPVASGSGHTGANGALPRHDLPLRSLPSDLQTDRVALTAANALDALQASCSIPFVLDPVRDIAGAPPGAHWDGGITDYHLHLPWTAGLATEAGPARNPPIVLVPHFQPQMVPGWLDKPWRQRHRATPWLDPVLLLCPSPAWIARLPGAKLPDRHDFVRHASDAPARQQAWRTAVAQSQQLADEWHTWLDNPDLNRVRPLA